MPPNANGPGANRAAAGLSLTGDSRSSSTAAADTKAPTRTAQAVHALRYRRLVRHLHQLGARPVGEVLLEVASSEALLLARLEFYARFSPAQIAALGADDWLDLMPRRCA